MPTLDLAVILGIGFISGVVSIMLFPASGLRSYTYYRTPLFVGGVIFMPLFIYVAALLPSPIPPETKAVLLPVGFAGFWASAAWLVSSKTQGKYMGAKEVRPGFLGGMPFRPDLILPGGVNFVKGVILTGIGFMIMFQPEFKLPVWNWWGFVLAFWGIIILIPIRGMVKLFHGRRKRFLGVGGRGTAFGITSSSILYAGLLILLYGFINAFMGTIPFTRLNPLTPIMAPFSADVFSVGLILVVLSYVTLGPIRVWQKKKLVEGLESLPQLVGKQATLYAGVLFLIYGYVTMFMGGFMTPQPFTNPVGFAVGVGLFILGALLILILRPLALRNELKATLRILPGVISDMPEEQKKRMIGLRMKALAEMPQGQREVQLKYMVEGLEVLPEEKRLLLRTAMMTALTELPADKMSVMMQAMDKVLMKTV